MTDTIVPMIIRGKIITDHLTAIEGRGGQTTFLTPDVHHYIDDLPLGNPGKLADLYTISFDEILDFLVALGEALNIETNAHMQEAQTLTYAASPMTPAMIDRFYANVGASFDREFLYEMADTDIGVAKLEGWVEEQVATGPRTRVRCFGSRALHIAAGNGPTGTVIALLRNALTRSDAIIKSPSNDPFTGAAILKTMCELDAAHPLTKHMSIAYWRGGDEDFERRLYQPHNIEKIVAWGGFASMKHVTKYIQPGLELISLDPKRSASVIGPEAFDSPEAMEEAATRLASDFGGFNQVGCTNSRVAYIQCGTDDDGLEKANAFAERAYEALATFPEAYSCKPKDYPAELKMKVNALRLEDDFYRVVGGSDDEGAVIVSQFPDAVDFMPEMEGRTINIVPIDDLEEFLDACDSYTQTVGVYPESLKRTLRDEMPLYGVQRIVSLGYASDVTMAGAQDAIQPMARMVKWVVDEINSPETRAPLWRNG